MGSFEPKETADQWRQKKCLPCEGGVDPIGPEQAKELMVAIPNWNLADGSLAIDRNVQCKNFVEAISLLNQIADVAEEEQHHPDLHLTGYRKLQILLTTHAIGGLSENDFIVAAKIDKLFD
jgi:4a-hydroxytetrahydrobiopterin dehydratase